MQQPPTIPDLLASSDFISLTKSQQALKLYSTYHFSKQQIVEHGVCTRQSFGRALKAYTSGRDAGKVGHPKDLSERDEAILAHWISDLLDQGEVVYTWKLLLLVWILLHSI